MPLGIVPDSRVRAWGWAMGTPFVKALRQMTTPPQKLDLRTRYEALYTATPHVARLVEVPPFDFLMVDGAGDPNTAVAYQLAIEALYRLAYGLKYAMRRDHAPVDYPVMPLEGLWWADDSSAFRLGRRDEWKWTLMIIVPDLITRDRFERTVAELGNKKPTAMLDRVRLERFDEGRAVQILHEGPYAEEPGTMDRLHAFVAERGLRLRGRHHEIYLNDPKRTPQAKLRTILRHPVG